MSNNSQSESTAKLWLGMESTIKEQQSQLRTLAEAVLECHGNDCSYYIECTCPVCELAREVQYADALRAVVKKLEAEND